MSQRTLFLAALLVPVVLAASPAMAGKVVDLHDALGNSQLFPAPLQAVHFPAGDLTAGHPIALEGWTLGVGAKGAVAKYGPDDVPRYDFRVDGLTCAKDGDGAHDCVLGILWEHGKACFIQQSDKAGSQVKVPCPASFELAQ